MVTTRCFSVGWRYRQCSLPTGSRSRQVAFTKAPGKVCLTWKRGDKNGDQWAKNILKNSIQEAAATAIIETTACWMLEFGIHGHNRVPVVNKT